MILYVANTLGYEGMGGGVAAYYELLALLATGKPVAVLTRKRVDLPSEVEGIKIKSPEWLTPDAVPLPLPGWTLDYWKAQKRLISLTRRIQKMKPQLLVVQGPMGHRLAEKYRDWDGIRRLMTIHSSPGQGSGIYHDGISSLERGVHEMQSYDAMVICSNRVAEKWKALPGLGDKKYFYIPNAADEATAKAVIQHSKADIRQQLNIDKNCFAVACVASVQYRKGQDLFVQHLDALVSCISNLHIYLVGPVLYGWGGCDFLARLDKAKHKDRIHIVGLVTPYTAMSYTYASDLFVLPTREDIFGIANAEAMLLNTPVVASDVDGIPELIENERTGLLFSHTRMEGFVDAIVRMAKDAEFRRCCTERAQVFYWGRFSRKLYYERWREVVARACPC